MDKSPDAFRTISEVAADLDLPQHVLRFWESKFSQIRPLKRGGGRRYYRPDDVELLKGIRYLLYGEGYTIRGVQRILKEQGVRFVGNVWRDGAPQPTGDRGQRSLADPGSADGAAAWEDARDEADGLYDEGEMGHEDMADEPDQRIGFASPVAVPQPLASSAAHGPASRGASEERSRSRFEAPVARAPSMRPAEGGSQPLRVARAAAAGTSPQSYEELDNAPRSALGSLIDRFRSGTRAGADLAGAPLNPALTREEVRHLQATLFELLECKRLLDQAR